LVAQYAAQPELPQLADREPLSGEYGRRRSLWRSCRSRRVRGGKSCPPKLHPVPTERSCSAGTAARVIPAQRCTNRQQARAGCAADGDHSEDPAAPAGNTVAASLQWPGRTSLHQRDGRGGAAVPDDPLNEKNRRRIVPQGRVEKRTISPWSPAAERHSTPPVPGVGRFIRGSNLVAVDHRARALCGDPRPCGRGAGVQHTARPRVAAGPPSVAAIRLTIAPTWAPVRPEHPAHRVRGATRAWRRAAGSAASGRSDRRSATIKPLSRQMPSLPCRTGSAAV